MLNKYNWDLYLRAGGNAVVSFFEKQLADRYTEAYADFIARFHKAYCPMQKVNDWVVADLRQVCDILCDKGYLLSEGEYCIESALEVIYTQILSESDGDVKSAFGKFSDNIVIYTTLLSIELSELFIPYYFQYNFKAIPHKCHNPHYTTGAK